MRIQDKRNGDRSISLSKCQRKQEEGGRGGGCAQLHLTDIRLWSKEPIL